MKVNSTIGLLLGLLPAYATAGGLFASEQKAIDQLAREESKLDERMAVLTEIATEGKPIVQKYDYAYVHEGISRKYKYPTNLRVYTSDGWKLYLLLERYNYFNNANVEGGSTSNLFENAIFLAGVIEKDCQARGWLDCVNDAREKAHIWQKERAKLFWDVGDMARSFEGFTSKNNRHLEHLSFAVPSLIKKQKESDREKFFRDYLKKLYHKAILRWFDYSIEEYTKELLRPIKPILKELDAKQPQGMTPEEAADWRKQRLHEEAMKLENNSLTNKFNQKKTKGIDAKQMIQISGALDNRQPNEHGKYRLLQILAKIYDPDMHPSGKDYVLSDILRTARPTKMNPRRTFQNSADNASKMQPSASQKTKESPKNDPESVPAFGQDQVDGVSK